MRVVLDSNIILSGIAYRDSIPRRLLYLGLQGKFELTLSDFILDEVEKNLVEKFGFRKDFIENAINNLRSNSTIVSGGRTLKTIKKDLSDNRILECALAAKADYLVSGDKKHILPLKKIGATKIVSASEFLRFLGRIKT